MYANYKSFVGVYLTWVAIVSNAIVFNLKLYNNESNSLIHSLRSHFGGLSPMLYNIELTIDKSFVQ